MEHLNDAPGPSAPPGPGGRRAAALVIVLIFSVGAIVLVVGLLSAATDSYTSAHEVHGLKALHAVARAGIAAAVNEINRDRAEGTFDPGGDGVGAITVGPDGRPGVAVSASDGRLLGRYRTTIRQDGARVVLVVVAVHPSFEDPRAVVAAEGEVLRGPVPFGANALSFDGETSAGGGAGLQVTGNPKVTITDPSLSVPAINASDPAWLQELIRELLPTSTVIGGDPDNPGAAASGQATVTNLPAGTISQYMLGELLTRLRGYVDTTAPGATPITTPDTVRDTTLPQGTYVIDGPLKLGKVLRGSGTLFVRDTVDIQNGGRLDWRGEVIVAGDAAALLHVESGGRLSVGPAGVLAVEAADPSSGLGLQLDGGGRLDVSGAVVALTGAAEDVRLEPGSRVAVTGVFALLGQDLELAFAQGSGFSVTGSVAFVVPPGATTGVDVITMRSGTEVTLTFSRADFVAALDALGEFFDPTGRILPVQVPSYWERGARTVLAEQEAALGGAGPWGMPW